MPFLLLLIIGVYLLTKCGISDLSLRRKMKTYMDAKVANGSNLPTDMEMETQLYNELEENYVYGDKSAFPAESLEFFAANPTAWRIWAKSEAEEKMIAAGYAPHAHMFSFDRTVHNNHHLYRMANLDREEKEFYRQKALREKYANLPV